VRLAESAREPLNLPAGSRVANPTFRPAAQDAASTETKEQLTHEAKLSSWSSRLLRAPSRVSDLAHAELRGASVQRREFFGCRRDQRCPPVLVA